jgi:hypothetical protein
MSEEFKVQGYDNLLFPNFYQGFPGKGRIILDRAQEWDIIAIESH